MGASGSQRGQEDWEIAFSFAASPTTQCRGERHSAFSLLRLSHKGF